MTRSQIELPEYFDRYINLCDDVTVEKAIEISIDEVKNAPLEKWKLLGLKTYAPNKWTVNELLQHIIDCERIFTYRALSFARSEQQQLPSFEEDEYVTQSKANDRKLEDLVNEMLALRQSTLAMYKSFTQEMLSKKGMGFKGLYSVASIGFIIAGHQRWHFKVLQEKYYPLI